MKNNYLSNPKQKIRIGLVALGGTIISLAEKITDEFYNAPSDNLKQIIDALPLDSENIELIYEQPFNQISHEMTHDEMLLIAKKISTLVHDDNIDGVIVIQGTNGIEETAYFTNLVIRSKKPIIFTGAFRPINSLGYDGSRNLFNAILLASSKIISGLGVVLTFNDCIVAAREASKLNPSVMGNFSIENAGLIGHIQGEHINIISQPNSRHTYCSEFNIDNITPCEKIHIIYGHLGIDDIFVKASIENGAKGIISAGMGKGYQPKNLTNALINASNKGIHIVRCTRSPCGTVNRDPKIDDHCGFIVGGSLSPQKSRILLSVALSVTNDRTDIQRIFNQY